ncbi:DUF3152 domain-containing protein [Saxibacter everestensis]|uniref:DUF3152 domain-containing protein n=1 Tax=Saxibacter everestensis TaxID=2909229 RepID=A0ABY8QNQ3_9MICO|nr:DUF3152 domain-containing protein [Brevibacteriaceae bacterium ZFBP1038]
MILGGADRARHNRAGRRYARVPHQRTARMLASAAAISCVVAIAIWVPVLTGGSASEPEELTAQTVPQAEASAPDESAAAPATEDAAKFAAPRQLEPSKEEIARLAAGIESMNYPQAGSGKLQTVPGGAKAPKSDAKVHTLRIKVEHDLPIDGEQFSQFVLTTLNDKRSWTRDGYSFARSDGKADTSLILASPETSEKLCRPLRTHGKVSCRNGNNVVLNVYRWIEGADDFGTDLTAYREYLVNHEVGHRLGHGHVSCPAKGKPAPVMMQQTYSTGDCRYNAWPYP